MKKVLKKVTVIVMFMTFLMASCMACHPSNRIVDDPRVARIGEMDADAAYGKYVASTAVMVSVNVLLDVREVQAMGLIDTDTYLIEGGGSGTVVMVRNKRSLILTAEHVCKTEPTMRIGFFVLPVMTTNIEIVTRDGTKMTARVLDLDETHDLCALVVDGVAGQPASIASELPPEYAFVSYVGAPDLTWGAGMAPMLDGRYCGIVPDDLRKKAGWEIIGEDDILITTPAIGGSSGSGIFYRGRLIGVLRVRGGMPNIVFSTNLSYVKEFVERNAGGGWSG